MIRYLRDVIDVLLIVVAYFAIVGLLAFGVFFLAEAQVAQTGAGKGTPTPPIAGYTGPGDVVGSATAYWGLRAYNNTYALATGNLADIVDTATGASSCTIKSKTNGDADLSSNLCVSSTLSVTTFCTVTHAAGCSITKLYDQSGASSCSGACDASQATLSKMPLLTLNCVGGKPCWVCQGAVVGLSYLANTTGPTVAAPFVYMATINVNSTGGNYIGQDAANDTQLASASSTTVSINQTNGSGLTATLNNGSWGGIVGYGNGASSAISVNGSDTTGASGASSTPTGVIGICAGGAGSGFGFANGTMTEAGVWPGSGFGTATPRNNMTSNMKTYWGF